jgi:hypothetical protein
VDCLVEEEWGHLAIPTTGITRRARAGTAERTTMKLFQWGLLLRYMVYGVLPLVVGFVILERRVGEGAAGSMFVALAFVLPFVAIGWLGYQHFRHRKH